jgi:prolyl-tRNA editing enzyme YbaK/EbsC (Cys-tRNA(Pro) deacylase)
MVNKMNSELPARAAMVQEKLNELGLDSKVVMMPDSCRTSQLAADSVGCLVAQIAKSLIFRAKKSGGGVLVIASGDNMVDTKKVGKLLGEKLGRADADFVREQTGFAIGGVAPVGHANPMPVFIDQDLFRFEEIWAAAGNPKAVFPLTPDDLHRITGGKVADVKQEKK